MAKHIAGVKLEHGKRRRARGSDSTKAAVVVVEVSNWWMILQDQVWWVLAKECRQEMMEKEMLRTQVSR